MELYYLTAGKCYLFWSYEDGRENPKLVIDIIDKMIDPDAYKGSYYLENFGWDPVWDQHATLSKGYFEFICMLEDVDDFMNPRIEIFLRKAISELFIEEYQWDR